MTPSRYEEVVANIVAADFRGFPNAQIFRNERFKGVRQPGKYETDVAVKFDIEGNLKYFSIFECKFLNRKVDRPIIQKIIQTRDAISAHKCVVVTNIGFSDEAIEVARANGVGLWIIGENTRVTVMGAWGPDSVVSMIIKARKRFAELISYRPDRRSDINLLNSEYCQTHPDFELANFIGGPKTRYAVSYHSKPSIGHAFIFDGSKIHREYSLPFVNLRFGMCEIFNSIFDLVIAEQSPMRDQVFQILNTFFEETNGMRETPIPPADTLSQRELSDVFRSICLPVNGLSMTHSNLTRFQGTSGKSVFFDPSLDEQLSKSTIFM